ncbi:MAG TPA: AraC family transcriptional regulator [Chitinophagales bacterium]|nr:AraC family transcriptional regulator [Chitinophagales bacterium]
MATDAFYLPDYFTGGKATDVYVQYYNTTQSSVKNKVVFSQHLLCLLLQGEKEVASAQVNHRINHNHILLLASGSVLMSETVTPQHRFESILFFFSNSFLTDFCIKHRLELASKKQATNMLVLNKDEYLHGFETTFALLRNTANAALQQLKLEELLLYLLLKYPVEIKAFINQALSANPATQQLKQVVSRYATQGLTIDELAFLCNMSASTFKRRFTEVFATSPKEYFTTTRMQRAKQLLTMGKPVAEVCNELGYTTLSLFSTAYKKYYGHPPGQVKVLNQNRKLLS